MAFKRRYEVTCDDRMTVCPSVGTVMAKSQDEANRILVAQGWAVYPQGQSCIHICPTHAKEAA